MQFALCLLCYSFPRWFIIWSSGKACRSAPQLHRAVLTRCFLIRRLRLQRRVSARSPPLKLERGTHWDLFCNLIYCLFSLLWIMQAHRCSSLEAPDTEAWWLRPSTLKDMFSVWTFPPPKRNGSMSCSHYVPFIDILKELHHAFSFFYIILFMYQKGFSNGLTQNLHS